MFLYYEFPFFIYAKVMFVLHWPTHFKRTGAWRRRRRIWGSVRADSSSFDPGTCQVLMTSDCSGVLDQAWSRSHWLRHQRPTRQHQEVRTETGKRGRIRIRPSRKKNRKWKIRLYEISVWNNKAYAFIFNLNIVCIHIYGFCYLKSFSLSHLFPISLNQNQCLCSYGLVFLVFSYIII